MKLDYLLEIIKTKDNIKKIEKEANIQHEKNTETKDKIYNVLSSMIFIEITALLVFYLNIMKLYPDISSFINYLFGLGAVLYFYFVFYKEDTISFSFFIKIKSYKKLLNKLEIRKGTEFYNHVRYLYLSKHDLLKTKEIYDQLESDIARKMFFHNYRYQNYLNYNFCKYANEATALELRENKEQIDKIISEELVIDKNVKYTLQEIKRKLAKQREKEDLMDIFKEEKLKENKNTAVLEL